MFAPVEWLNSFWMWNGILLLKCICWSRFRNVAKLPFVHRWPSVQKFICNWFELSYNHHPYSVRWNINLLSKYIRVSSSLSPSPFGFILSQYRAHPVWGVFFPWEILQSATQTGGGDFCGLSQCVGGERESRHGPLRGLWFHCSPLW